MGLLKVSLIIITKIKFKINDQFNADNVNLLGVNSQSEFRCLNKSRIKIEHLRNKSVPVMKDEKFTTSKPYVFSFIACWTSCAWHTLVTSIKLHHKRRYLSALVLKLIMRAHTVDFYLFSIFVNCIDQSVLMIDSS